MPLSLHLLSAASPETHGQVSSQAWRAFCRAKEGISGDLIAQTWSPTTLAA